MALAMTVDPAAAAVYFVEKLGCTAFPVYGTKPDGRCMCGDPHDGTTKQGTDNVGKHPATPHGFKDGTDNLERIRTFLKNPGTPNYGLNAPPGVLVIDVDGAEGLAQWEALQHQHGPLPVTLTTTTAHGRHYFYRWPTSVGPMPTGKLFGFVVRRHDDGYVIGPGSVHPTGVVYDTLRQPSGMPYDIAELPTGWARAALTAKPLVTVGGRLDVTPPIGGRHDWLRDTARLYAGTVRDPGALKAAVMAANAKIADPKSEADVDKAIGDVLAKFPPDPVELDPTTGAVVRVPVLQDGEHYDQLAMHSFPDPPLPVAFGGLLGEVSEAILEFTDASRVGILATLAAMLGGTLGVRGVYHTEQPCAIMTGLVGVTSEARKSTTIDLAWTTLMTSMGASYSQRFDGLNSGEALVARLMKMQATGGAHGVLVEDEFSRLLVSARREGSTLDAMLRTAFDGRALNVFTRNSSADLSVIPPYAIAAVSAITPKELRKLITPTMLVNGSVNRWLWVPVIRRDVVSLGDRLVRLPLELTKRLVDVLDHVQKVQQPIATEALAASRLNDYGNWLSKIEGLAGDMGRRLNVIAFRVALVHATLDKAATVMLEHVDRAIALTEYARAGLGWVFGQLTGMKEADLLARAVAAAGGEGLTLTDVTRKLIRSPVVRQEAIDAVMDLGLVRVERLPNPAGTGRPIQRLVWVPDEQWVGGVFSTFDPGGLMPLKPQIPLSANASEGQLQPYGINANNSYTYRDEREINGTGSGPETPLVSTDLTVDPGNSETVRCHFYKDHQFEHRPRPSGVGHFCPICSPEDAA